MKLRLMADYECHPLWERLESGVRNLPPSELPLSKELKEALEFWAHDYDATLRRDDPAASTFPSEKAEHQFEATGLRLWAALRAELGLQFTLPISVKSCAAISSHRNVAPRG